MSLKLTNRLDQIENDIRLMLMLQKCGNITRASPTTSVAVADSNHSSSILSGISACTQRQQVSSPVQSVSNKHVLPVSPVRQGISLKPSKESLSPGTESTKPPLKLYCSCGSPLSEFSNKAYAEVILEDVKPYCRNCYFSPGLEFEYEQVTKRKLENDLARLKSELSSVAQSKEIAVTMTKQLKKKYEKMKSSLEKTNSKLVDMSKEKDFLCKCLEREKTSNSSKINTKPTATNRVDATTSYTDVNGELEAIEEYDERMKSLQESMLVLSNQVQEKETEKQNAITQRNKMEHKLKKQKDITKKLSEINQKLANSIRTKHESFMALRNNATKCQKEMERYKSNWNQSLVELEKLKQVLQTERNQGDAPNESKSPDVSEELRKAYEIIQMLNKKVRNTEENVKVEAHREIIGLEVENEQLRAKVDDLIYKLKRYQEEDAKALTLQRQSQLNAGIPSALHPKIDELVRHTEDQKRKIEELDFLKQQQDILIKSQHEQLISKEEEILLHEQETEMLRGKCLHLDKQLEKLRNMLNTKDAVISEDNKATLDSNKDTEFENKIEELRGNLKTEKEKVSEQEKIIKDLTNEVETMRKLSVALEESKDQLEMTIRELEREKETSKIVVEGLEKLNSKKEKLEDMMGGLEEACKSLLMEKDQYAKFCNDLKEQLEEEKKLRTEECGLLMEEKNKAFEVARLAAMTLIETVDDYEVLTKSQMEAKRSITDIVKNKHLKRRPGCPPVPSLKYKDSQTSSIDRQPNDETSDTTANVSMINMKYASDADVEEPSSSECAFGNEEKRQTTPTCFNEVTDSKGCESLPISVTTINPYVQSAVISTTPYACWFRNCAYLPNQTLCGIPNGNPLPSATFHCQCSTVRNRSQPKSAKVHAPIRVTSKKSTCATPRKKRAR